MTFDCTSLELSRLTSRLEDVQYRFALADTDEKLERTLKVPPDTDENLTTDLSCSYSPQTQYNLTTCHSQGSLAVVCTND